MDKLKRYEKIAFLGEGQVRVFPDPEDHHHHYHYYYCYYYN